MQLIKDNCQASGRPDFKSLNKSPLASGDESRPALLIYDAIDPWWGVSAEMVKSALLDFPNATDIDVFINSPGGDVFEATAIHSALIAHPAKIHVKIEGVAASAATRIAMAGDTIEMAESGMYMIHYAWTFAMGNASEMRKSAELLDKIDNTIVADYAKGSNADEVQLRQWMEEETWFNAEEAKEHGFIHNIIERNSEQPTNKNWNLSAYHNAPEPPKEEMFEQRERLSRYANMLTSIG